MLAPTDGKRWTEARMDTSYRIAVGGSPGAGRSTGPAIGEDAPTREGTGALDGLGTTISVRKDAEIYSQGDAARHCYRVVSGCVRTVKLMEDGRRQVGEFLLAGDWLGCEALEAYDFAAEAVSHVVLRRYPRRAIEQLAERDAALGRLLCAILARELRRARDRMVTLGRKTACERVAEFLLEMTQRVPKDKAGGIALPMSRTDIADHLGLTIETVCRTLAHLRKAGVIALARNSLAVRDRRALVAFGCATRH
jgi:CRP/FNR family nitrogen fixation transcriptional regulator